VDKRVAAVRKAYKERKDITTAIKSLEKMVQVLPVQIRGKFSGFGTLAGKVSAEAQQAFLDKAEAKINGLFEAFVRKEGQKRLSRLLDTYTGRTGADLKRVDLLITPDLRRQVQVAADAAGMSVEQAREKADGFRDEQTGDFKSDQDFVDYGIYAIFAGSLSSDASPAKVLASVEALREMLRTGRSKAQAFVEAKKAEISRVVEGSISAITRDGDKKLSSYEMTENEQKLLRTALRTTKHWAFDSLDGLQHILDNLATEGGRFETFLHDEIFTPVTVATLEKFERIEKWSNRFRESIHNSLGDRVSDTLAEWGKIKDSGIWFVADGVPGEKRMTIWQGIQFYMRTMENGTEPTILEMVGNPPRPKREKAETDESFSGRLGDWEKQSGNRIETLQSQLESFIGDDGKKVARQIQGIYKDLGKEFIEESERIDGIRPEVVDGYAGRLIRKRGRQEYEEALQNMGANDYLRENAKNGSFKSRTENTHEFVIQGADTTLMAHIHSMSHAYAFAEWARKANALISDPEFSRAVRQRSGSTETIRLLKRQFDLVSRGHMKTEVFDSMFTSLIKTITISKLILNYTSAVKQIGSIPAFMEGIPVKEYAKYASKLTPSKIREMRETSYMRHRYAVGMDRVLRDIKEWNPGKGLSEQQASIYQHKNAWNVAKRMLTTDPAKMPSYDERLDAGMFMTQEMDAWAIAVGGRPVYDYHFDKKFAETGDYDAARKHAEIKFAEASNYAQQSSQPQDLGWFQTLGPFGKLLTSYATSPIQYQRNINNAIRAFKNRRISGSQLAKTFFVFHVLLPQIFVAMGSAIAALMFEDERDWEKVAKRQKQALILGNLNVVPLFGMAAQQFANKYAGMNWRDPSTVVFDTMNKLGGGFADLLLGLEDGDGDKIEKGLGDVLESGGSLIGAPVSAIEKTSQVFEDED